MAEIWGLAIAAGATLVAADMQGDAATNAANAGRDAGNAGIAEQRAAREQFQDNINPYLETGGQFNSILGRLAAGDQTAYTESPGYQFQLGQGMQTLDRGAAAQGNYRSGGTDADRLRFSQGLAASDYGNFFNQTMQGAQLGANAAVGAGNIGQNSANSISGLYGNIGNAQANGAIGQANANSNAVSGLAGLAGQYLGNRGTGYQQPQTNYGAFAPNQGSNFASNGMLGPSNGQNWNFGA